MPEAINAQPAQPNKNLVDRAIGTGAEVVRENFNNVVAVAGPFRKGVNWIVDKTPNMGGWKEKVQNEWNNPTFPTAYKVAGTAVSAFGTVTAAVGVAGTLGGIGAAGAIGWGASKYWDKITPQGAVTAAGIGLASSALPALVAGTASQIAPYATGIFGLAVGGKAGHDDYKRDGNLGSAVGKGVVYGAAAAGAGILGAGAIAKGAELMGGAVGLGSQASTAMGLTANALTGAEAQVIGTQLFTRVGVATGAAGAAGYTAAKANFNAEGNTIESAVATGKAAALAAGLASFAIGPEATINAIAAPTAAAVAAMAANPNQTIILQPPGLKNPVILRTPGDKPAARANPMQTVTDITTSISEFRKTHPEGMNWQDPDKVAYEKLKSLVNDWKKSSREKIRADLAALPANANLAAKVARLDESLRNEGITGINPADLQSLVPVVESLSSREYVKARQNANKQINILVEKASIFSTIAFIHCTRLGLEGPDVDAGIKQIIEEATAPGADGLWSIYRRTIGKDLKWYQVVSAGFWYFITSSIGVIPNGIKAFTDRLLDVGRTQLEEGKSETVNRGINEALKQVSLFLEVYNGAAEKYSVAVGPEGDLNHYQRMVIDRLGNDNVYQEVRATIKPDEKFGDKMMEVLCKKFTHSLIDNFFERVPFFDRLKQTNIFGKAIFGALDYLLGGIINWAGKKLLKSKLPGIVQSLLQTGLDQTLPGKWEYKIAIAEGLNDQLIDLQAVMRKMDSDLSKPMKKMENATIDDTVKKTENATIDDTVQRILIALDIKRLGETPSRDKVKGVLNTKNDPELHEQLQEVLVIGIQALINHYSSKPEKLEELLGQVVRLSSDALKPSAKVQTKDDFEASFKKLRDNTNVIIDLAIEDACKDAVIGKVKANTYMKGHTDAKGVVQKGLYEIQKTHAEDTFVKLERLSAAMKARMELDNPMAGGNPLIQLDQYAETMKEFANHTNSLGIDDYTEETRHLFHETFHSIFTDAALIVQPEKVLREEPVRKIQEAGTLSKLQKPEVLFHKYSALVAELKEIDAMHRAGQKDAAEYEKKLRALRQIEKTFTDYPIEDLNGTLVPLEADILRLKEAITEAKHAQGVINKLQTLQKPERFVDNLLGDALYWNKHAREVVPPEDQRVLFELINEMQTLLEDNSRPDITDVKARIAQELRDIRQRHRDTLDAKIRDRDQTLEQFAVRMRASLATYETEKTTLKETITDLIDDLKEKTTDLLKKIRETKMEQALFVGEYVGHGLKDYAKETKGAEMKEKFQPYLNTVWEGITSRNIYEGLGRVLLGNLTERLKPTPAVVNDATHPQHPDYVGPR